jgi:monoamine oxidase
MAKTTLFRSLNRIMNGAIRNEPFWANVRFTRRQGLYLGGMTGISSYLSSCRTLEEGMAKTGGSHDYSPPVIVGAGAAGLSAAHYLKKAGIKSHLFEADARIGGRILTQYGFNKENMFCERGGELIDTGHKDIQNLMTELGLELESLPDSTLRHEVYSFERRWRTEEELITAFRPLAKRIAKDAENFVVQGAFTLPTYENPISSRVKDLDHMSLKAYLDQATETPKWVRELIRIAYVGEYGLEAEDQSAINLVTFIATDLEKGFKMFGESDELYRIKGGSSKLIDALGRSIEGQISLKHTLRSIALAAEGRIQLLFEVSDPEPRSRSAVVEVLADHVILALPFTVLREVRGIGAIGLQPRKLQAIRELGYGTNSKLMLGFSRRYWREGLGGSPKNDGGVVSDLALQGGWDSSRKQQGESGIFTNFTGGRQGQSLARTAVKDALEDLEKLYPGISSLHDSNTALQVWPAIATAKGSYICQKPGQYTAFGGCLSTTELGGRLIFAGEHTSDAAAGFMSGAVESGLRAATQYLNVHLALVPEPSLSSLRHPQKV